MINLTSLLATKQSSKQYISTPGDTVRYLFGKKKSSNGFTVYGIQNIRQ